MNSKQAITDASDAGVVLAARAKEAGMVYVPEQPIVFELALENLTPTEMDLVPLNGGNGPRLRVIDALGVYVVHGADMKADLRAFGPRVLESPVAREVRKSRLSPHARNKMDVNVAEYGPPLHRGKHLFDAVHFIDKGVAVRSNRVEFEVVGAKVLTAAVGLGRCSEMLWLAQPEIPGAKARLLGRRSALTGHHVMGTGAYLGETVPTARLALSRFAPGGDWGQQWFAVASGRTVEVIAHNSTKPEWRSGPIDLPFEAAVPVARFPGRDEYAIVLISGVAAGKPVLGGVKVTVEAGEGTIGQPWTIRLSTAPKHIVCAFEPKGPIAVLWVSDDGAFSRVHRLDVDEAGVAVYPEHIIRVTPNRILAVTADMPSDGPQSFLLLESDRARAGRVGILKIPVASTGPFQVALAPVSGWPELDVQAVVLETDTAGTPKIGLVDAQGRLFGGDLGGILQLTGPDDPPVVLPHIIAFEDHGLKTCTISAFDDHGYLLHRPMPEAGVPGAPIYEEGR